MNMPGGIKYMLPKRSSCFRDCLEDFRKILIACEAVLGGGLMS